MQTLVGWLVGWLDYFKTVADSRQRADFSNVIDLAATAAAAAIVR
jgi:hypothetical protein